MAFLLRFRTALAAVLTLVFAAQAASAGCTSELRFDRVRSDMERLVEGETRQNLGCGNYRTPAWAECLRDNGIPFEERAGRWEVFLPVSIRPSVPGYDGADEVWFLAIYPLDIRRGGRIESVGDMRMHVTVQNSRTGAVTMMTHPSGRGWRPFNDAGGPASCPSGPYAIWMVSALRELIRMN